MKQGKVAFGMIVLSLAFCVGSPQAIAQTDGEQSLTPQNFGDSLDSDSRDYDEKFQELFRQRRLAERNQKWAPSLNTNYQPPNLSLLPETPPVTDASKQEPSQQVAAKPKAEEDTASRKPATEKKPAAKKTDAEKSDQDESATDDRQEAEPKRSSARVTAQRRQVRPATSRTTVVASYETGDDQGDQGDQGSGSGMERNPRSVQSGEYILTGRDQVVQVKEGFFTHEKAPPGATRVYTSKYGPIKTTRFLRDSDANAYGGVFHEVPCIGDICGKAPGERPTYAFLTKGDPCCGMKGDRVEVLHVFENGKAQVRLPLKNLHAKRVVPIGLLATFVDVSRQGFRKGMKVSCSGGRREIRGKIRRMMGDGRMQIATGFLGMSTKTVYESSCYSLEKNPRVDCDSCDTYVANGRYRRENPIWRGNYPAQNIPSREPEVRRAQPPCGGEPVEQAPPPSESASE